MTLVVYTCLDIRYQPQEYRAKSEIARTAHLQGRQHSIAGVWETRRCSEGRPQGCMGWGEAGHQTIACGNPCLLAPSRCASMIATKNRFLPASVHGLHPLHAQIFSPTASLARTVPGTVPGVLQRLAFWSLIAILACALGTLSVAHPAATALTVTALVSCGAWSNNREKTRLQALAATRNGESICGFARSFDLRSTDPLVIRAVYAPLQSEAATQATVFH